MKCELTTIDVERKLDCLIRHITTHFNREMKIFQEIERLPSLNKRQKKKFGRAILLHQHTQQKILNPTELEHTTRKLAKFCNVRLPW